MKPDERPPRLQPPPRVVDGDGTSGSTPDGSGRFRWVGVAVLLGILLGLTFIVFALLPGWTANRLSKEVQKAPPGFVATQDPVPPQHHENPAPVATAALAAPAGELQPTAASPRQGAEARRRTPVTRPDPDEAAYVAAMSRGLEALERDDWNAAREAFETASDLRPGAPEVKDGLARAAASERRALVRAGTQRGQELEFSEAWNEAVAAYERVLAIDPEAAGALDGRDRAAARAVLDEKLQYHIDNPSRLSSQDVFEDASELVEEGRNVRPQGPRLHDQLARLEHMLDVASTPIPVVVESDNLTNVVIYRVDRLGAFARRRLQLRPGTYTAVGSRDGFRDVRVRFTVSPGAPPDPVRVVCTEKL